MPHADPAKRAECKRRWVKNNPEKRKRQALSWYQRNKEKQRDAVRAKKLYKTPARKDYNLRRKYGITLEEFEHMLADLGGRCPICGRVFNNTNRRTKACVDHSHATGRVRGVICSDCNVGIGCFGDNPELLEKAKSYLLTSGGLDHDNLT